MTTRETAAAATSAAQNEATQNSFEFKESWTLEEFKNMCNGVPIALIRNPKNGNLFFMVGASTYGYVAKNFNKEMPMMVSRMVSAEGQEMLMLHNRKLDNVEAFL